MDAQSLADLRQELRSQCGFRDIAALLVERTMLTGCLFFEKKRTTAAHTRFGGHGRARSSWATPTTPDDLFPGWTATCRWTVAPDDAWKAQRLLRQLQVHGDENMSMKAETGARTFHQQVVLFADDFPGMWLADKLRGHLD